MKLRDSGQTNPFANPVPTRVRTRGGVIREVDDGFRYPATSEFLRVTVSQAN